MISGWWFGTWISFFPILGISIPTDFHIFQRGWSHQQDIVFPCFPTIHRISFQTYGSCDKPLGWCSCAVLGHSSGHWNLPGLNQTCWGKTRVLDCNQLLLYVFYMYSICILYVFYMYSICILYVFYMYSMCILSVFYLYSICILYVFYMYSICILYVFYMYSICILYVFYMYSICTLYGWWFYGWRQGIVRIRKSGWLPILQSASRLLLDLCNPQLSQGKRMWWKVSPTYK